MKILVTGAGGFIGLRLLQRLLSEATTSWRSSDPCVVKLKLPRDASRS